jgi:hypothetical protein
LWLPFGIHSGYPVSLVRAIVRGASTGDDGGMLSMSICALLAAVAWKKLGFFERQHDSLFRKLFTLAFRFNAHLK